MRLLELIFGTKAKDISDEDANKLRNEIEKKYKVEGEIET